MVAPFKEGCVCLLVAKVSIKRVVNIDSEPRTPKWPYVMVVALKVFDFLGSLSVF